MSDFYIDLVYAGLWLTMPVVGMPFALSHRYVK